MADSTTRIDQAAALHRQAEATVEAAALALGSPAPPDTDPLELHHLAEELRAAAHELAPGWLGAPLDAQAQATPLGGVYPPQFVRLGLAQPLDDAGFPVVIPLLGTGHLAIDADANDARVSGLLRCLLLRLLAAAPAGSLLVRAVDGTGGGSVFAPFAALADAGLISPPATDRDGLRDVLADAEKWLRPSRVGVTRRARRERMLLLVIASLPAMTEGADLTRIAALAQQGPESGLHLIVAGWPPAPLTAETTQPPLPRTTRVSVRNPYAVIGDPPGATFGSVPEASWLNAPVFLDEDPPPHLVEAVCQELAGQSAAASAVTLADLLPLPDEPLWTVSAADGLSTTVGHAGDIPVVLQFNDLSPHWMVGGRSGAGKTAFLVDVLYALGARYGPDEMALYLLDLKGVSFAEFLPSQRDRTWLPHVRAVGVEADREYGLAVLRELDAEMGRRSVAYTRAGVTRFADLRAAAVDEGWDKPMPRILCVIDEFQVLLAGTDPISTAALPLLESLARKGRSYGIHLILASQNVLAVDALFSKRDSIFGQFPVRIALPGGGDVLEPTNDSAAGLPLGSAVVNMAGGLGGPRGATRAHERVVSFPDPHADQALLSDLRHKLWAARDPESTPPRVFAGYARQHLADDPTYRAALAGRSGRPAALVGRAIDVEESTAAFPLDSSPGRHLAIFSAQPSGAEVLDAAARSVAAFHAPRTARFVISSLVAEGDELAKALAVEIGHRQEAVLVTARGLAAEFQPDRPGYLVVFGLDAANPGSLPDLPRLLREGPSHGVHLLSWWRGFRRFAEETGGAAGREDVAGLVFLDSTNQDVTLALGRPSDWQPRDNRALLHDRKNDRSVTFVPFVQPESSGT